MTFTNEQLHEIIAEGDNGVWQMAAELLQLREVRPQFRVGDRVRLKDSVTDEDLQDISITHGRRYVPNVMTVTERSPMHRIYTDSEFNFAPTMLEHVK